jgi:hypothetical protein
MRTASRILLTLALGAAIAMPAGAFAQTDATQGTPPNAQVPQPDQGGVNWKGVGIGAGTVAGNIFYIPAKLVYGILGGIAGGAGYALTGGNKQVADTIWRSSLGGDYVLTPDMVSGKDPVHFSGPTTTAPGAQTSAADSGAAAASTLAPAPSAGASAPSSLYAATPPVSSSPGTHPIDNGAGPVSGGGGMSGSYYGGSSANSGATVAPRRSQSSDSSIE